MLYRGGFRLALEAVETVAKAGRLSHLGAYVDDGELGRLRTAPRMPVARSSSISPGER